MRRTEDAVARMYFETYGCQMNEADSRFLAEAAITAGYEIVATAADANVLVLNTCTVRASAEKRAYSRLGNFTALKKADPSIRVVVCGCLAEQDRADLLQRVPLVDALFGTHELPAMSEKLASWVTDYDTETVVETRALLAPLGALADAVVDAFTHLRAYINVQYGCSYYCTYCIVPHVRGRFAHRPLAEILTEVRARIAAGAREITLVGQTVNAYREPTTELDFAGLLRAVAAVPGLEKLGFITSHPNDLSADLLQTFADVPALNPRFHLALQSGSDPVLKRMNRKYTLAAYKERIAAFRVAAPTWALTTDIITGFPGETEDDFTATLEVLEAEKFAQVYVFAYSPRRGTPAANWPQLPQGVGITRLQRAMEIVNRHVQAYHAQKVGTTVRALVQGPSRKEPTRLAAKTPDNVTVIVPITGNAERFAATPWLDVEIERDHIWGCAGRLIGVAEHFSGPNVPLPQATAAVPALIDLIAG